jgi:hypothetical protein
LLVCVLKVLQQAVKDLQRAVVPSKCPSHPTALFREPEKVQVMIGNNCVKLGKETRHGGKCLYFQLLGRPKQRDQEFKAVNHAFSAWIHVCTFTYILTNIFRITGV